VRVDVDWDRCEGHAICEALAPEVFSVDDDGKLTIVAPEVPVDSAARVEDAVVSCPVAALRATR
jgi:ferredoxin